MNSWHIGQLKYAFGIGGLMSFYGIVGMIVYMLPASSVGSTQKIVVIALVLLTMPFALLLGYVATRRSKKKAEKAAAATAAEGQAAEKAPDAAPAAKAAPVGTFNGIIDGTEETVQFLKNSNLGSGGKDAVYSLPWYVIAGTPRAGKSSLVLGSNLNFQTLPSQRQSELRTLRPTGSIDWRVTSDAVFVDTAGRYQTEGIDGEEWSSLLETIKKYRSNRPLDGFLLVVDAEKIIRADERESEEMAKVLRARLDDAMQRLKVRFPVYLVFTHADSIEGFRDSFSASKNEDKTLVWGATIPLDKSDNAQALFDSEFEKLHNAVTKRRIIRLSAPFPPVRQLRIFNFPLHFGATRRKFGAFVNALFRPNPFSENPLLRGFYFTAAPAGKQSQAGGSYFTERFFRDVILRDKDLVKTFQANRQRPPIFGWMMTFLLALLVVSLLAMSGLSLYKNKQLLAEAEEKGEKMLTIVKADAGKNPLDKKEEDARKEINTTDDLRSLLVTLDDYDRNGAPFYMRFGLYSGEDVYKQNLLKMYFSVVEQRFKGPTVRKVEADLKKFAASSPVANPGNLTEAEEKNLGKHYDLLKAYLMLSGEYKARAEATHIANTLKDYWTADSKVPGDLKLAAVAQLDFWAKQVDRDDDDFRFPRITADAKLVEDTRRKLQAFPAVYRYYSRKVTEISKEIDDQVGTTTVESILARNGADTTPIEGNYSVPSAFTRPGYELMKTAIAEADQKLSEDDWVMGEAGKKEVAQATDASKLQDRYHRDYADHWVAFVKGVNVKPYKNKEEATQALQTFSLANSPMKILLREIAKNTNLSAKPEAQGWWDWIMSFVQKKKATETGGSEPEKQFRPLFTFVGTPEQAETAPIERYQSEIAKAFNAFNLISEDKMKDVAQKMANDQDPLGLRKNETVISTLTGTFNETPAGQELAQLIQAPLGNLRNLLGAGAQKQIEKAWSEQILPAAKEIEKGFPFDDSGTDADLTKLSAYLNPADGKFSKFFDERLSKYFEESNGQYKLKDTAEVKFSDEFVAYVNNAFALRKALFGTSPTPKFEYEFTLKAPKDSLIEVVIDGQKVSAEGTGSIKGSFPPGGSAETGVIVTSGSSTDAAATTSPPPSANSANSNVSSPSGNVPASSSASSLRFPGNWGLFRFVDAGKPQKQAGGDYLLTYTVGGKAVNATIKSTGGDLFDKSIFRQLKAPQSFLK